MRATDRRCLGWFLVAAVSAVASGCANPSPPPHDVPFGLSHDEGSTFIETRAHYGIPILRKSFFWDGEGEVDNTGLGFHVGRHIAEGVAVGIGSNLVTWWTPGHDVFSVEVESLLRVHPLRDWPVFVDGTAGYQLANDQIPPGGTVWNFTFSFGGGVEFPIDKGTAIVAGLDYHHISNALGRENDRNPSQNEARMWIGVEWSF